MRKPATIRPLIMLNIAQTADALGVERKTVYQMIQNGLPLYRIGVKRKILIADLIDYIRKNFKREA